MAYITSDELTMFLNESLLLKDYNINALSNDDKQKLIISSCYVITMTGMYNNAADLSNLAMNVNKAMMTIGEMMVNNYADITVNTITISKYDYRIIRETTCQSSYCKLNDGDIMCIPDDDFKTWNELIEFSMIHYINWNLMSRSMNVINSINKEIEFIIESKLPHGRTAYNNYNNVIINNYCSLITNDYCSVRIITIENIINDLHNGLPFEYIIENALISEEQYTDDLIHNLHEAYHDMGLSN